MKVLLRLWLVGWLLVPGGAVCVDGDYVYISVGTNAWKRATLEAW